MASKMMGGGGMPGGMPGMGGMPPNFNRQQTMPNPSTAPALTHGDFVKATALKEEAGALFKAKKLEEAASKYYQATNLIRMSDEVKNH